MDYREMLNEIPGSYDDFVNSTARWMEKDPSIREAILKQIENNSDSDTQDIMKVLWKCLGIGEPLTIVDDEEEKPKRSRKSSIAGKVAAF